MLSIADAKDVIKKAFPNRNPKFLAPYGPRLYIFEASNPDDPLEGNMDPYYSVDKVRGTLSEFPIYKNGAIKTIEQYMMKTKGVGNGSD